MKKIYKGIITAAAVPAVLTGTLALFNKAIYINANRNSEISYNNETYCWKYGNVNYEKSGSGRPLILIHSLYAGSSLAEWKKSAKILSKFYTVYNIDLPGYGYSEKPKMSYAAFTYAAFLNDFAQDVIKKPVFMIAANGSATSAVMSAKNYETIEKLMVVSPKIYETAIIKRINKLKRSLIELPVFGTAFYNLKTTRFALKKNITNHGYFAK
jgi:pimeloyl-ACP methyl ester carboxylesterase